MHRERDILAGARATPTLSPVQALPVNFAALVAAAVVRMVIGAVWYAPPVLGKPWMALVGMTPEKVKAGMGRAIAVDLAGSLVMAFVLTHAARYAGASTPLEGAAVGFFCWIGFVATVTLAITIYEQRPMKLFWINNGFQLISLLIMGAILAVWI
jgi:hypothetical protein